MSAALLFDVLLCLLACGVAFVAVTARDAFAGIVFFITFGILAALAWVRLGAVDVALAEAAIGAGLTGILLMAATGRMKRRDLERHDLEHHELRPAHDPPPRSVAARALPFVLCLVLSGGLAAAILAMPDNRGLTPLAMEHIGLTGVTNPVTAVLLNYRAYDTLLESVVLLAALIGVWSLASDRCWPGRPGLRQHALPHGVLAYFGRLLPPVGLLIGIHLLWAGADAPGGAFQAGTVIAAVWLLAAMAGLADVPAASSRPLRLVLVAGPALFLGAGLTGAALGTFLGLAPAIAKPAILAIETALTASIAATLALLVLGVPSRAP